MHSRAVFTGGSDGYIKYWRLRVDSEPLTLDFHEGVFKSLTERPVFRLTHLLCLFVCLLFCL